MGGYVGGLPACYGSSLGSNPDISQKYRIVDISKEVGNILQLAKNIQKNMLSEESGVDKKGIHKISTVQ
jgi:hypothetical protein